jgi:hypothetical protein
MSSFKFVYGDVMRRVLIREDGGKLIYSQLINTLLNLFPSLAGKNFQIYWEDDEGDLILCSSDAELDEAVNVLQQSKVLKFIVKLPNGDQSEPAAVPLESIDMRTVLHAHRCADLNEALLQALPFKIPVADAKLVQQYPNVFELSASTVDLAVRSFLEYSKIGQSETSTVIIDGHWLKALRRCLNGVYILQNEYDESSIQDRRPDSSVQVFNALALKGEAKFSIADLPIAFGELTSKFHRDAYKVFPKGCNSIVAITSCIDRIDMNIHI